MLIALVLLLAAPPVLPRAFSCEADGKTGNYGLRLGGAKVAEGTLMQLLSGDGVMASGRVKLAPATHHDEEASADPADDLYERNFPSATMVVDSSSAARIGELQTGNCIALVLSDVKKIEFGRVAKNIDWPPTIEAKVLALEKRPGQKVLSAEGPMRRITVPGFPGDFLFGFAHACSANCKSDGSYHGHGYLLGPEPARAILSTRADWTEVDLVARIDGAVVFLDHFNRGTWRWDLDLFDGKSFGKKGHTIATGGV